jgi:hypothetical protein
VRGVLVDEQQSVLALDEQIARPQLAEAAQLAELERTRGRGAGPALPCRFGGLGSREDPVGRGRLVGSAVPGHHRARPVANGCGGRRRRRVGCGCGACEPAAPRDRLAHAAPDESVDCARVGKAHLPLRRVHVHVDFFSRHGQDYHRDGEAPARQPVAIHVEQRLSQQPVAHGAAVDEQVQAIHVRPRVLGRRHERLDVTGRLFVLDGHEGGGVAFAQHRGDAIQGIGGRGPDERRLVVALHLEVHAG